MTYQADNITSIPAPTPSDYDRQFSFLDWERNNPGVPYPAAGLEAEFNAIERTTDETQARLRLIQRDDGALKNGSVGLDQLSVEARIGVEPPTTWTEFTSYTAGNSVIYNNIAWYVAAESHVSSNDFPTDLGEGKWILLLDFSAFYTTEAQHWADYPEDQLVPEGNLVDDYSALHHAAKASADASTASTARDQAVAAAATLNLPAPTETDKVLTGNGTDGFVFGPRFTASISGGAIPVRTGGGRLTSIDPVNSSEVVTLSYLGARETILSGQVGAVTATYAVPLVRKWVAESAAEANGWQGVCWSPELGLFAAVSSDGTNRVMTSPDGATWTPRTAAAANSWAYVCWSPELGLFAAVALDGTSRVMTSPDGITWTARTAAEANAWTAVCWSPDQSIFVAVSIDGTNRVMTSPDGITWTARTAAEANAWRDVVWASGLGLFVAVSNTGTNRVMTSPDGITWTARAIPVTAGLQGVAWSEEGETLVAVASTGQVFTSPDGTTWTQRSTPETVFMDKVVWSPELGLFAAVAKTGTYRLMTSPDGVEWTLRKETEANSWGTVCWSPEQTLFVAVASSGTNRVMTSL